MKPLRQKSSRTVPLLLAIACSALALVAGPSRAQGGPWGQTSDAGYRAADVTYPNYRFRDGQVLSALRVHYLTLGRPHRNHRGEIDNAVLVLHWTGADSAAVTTQAFTQALYAPGRPLDSSRYFLIFPDAIGCGHTSKPSDGLRARFPDYGYGDMVDIQHKLVTETLGIHHLHAILGMSMGGMNAWQWAEAYPHAMDGVMPVVSLPVKVSGRNAIWRHLVVDLIRDDPEWRNGDYRTAVPGFAKGYALLRMMIDGVDDLQRIAPDGDRAEAFLDQVTAESRRADPNDVLFSLKSSADYDPEPSLPSIRAKVFALNFDDDEFNPDRLGILERLVPTIRGARYVVQKGTEHSFGHLTMAHPELWSEQVGAFMRELDQHAPAPGKGARS
jgi:homoserine O-acetyltransferase